MEETNGGAYQLDCTEKGDVIDRVKWRNGVYELSTSTR